MNILVTGACGFIGSHLVEKLVKLNYNVKAFTNYNSQNSYGWIENIDSKILKNIEVISGDIRDYEFLNKKTKTNFFVVKFLSILNDEPAKAPDPKGFSSRFLKLFFSLLLSLKNIST